MNRPLFSIIVPIYNVEQYINKCIESILAQSYKNYEVILVDDGSPDNCPSICDRYKADNPKVRVIHKNNGGLVSARQAGVSLATGRYIICVDGDDWIREDYLEQAERIIEKFTPDIICFGFYIAIGEKNIEKKLSNRIGFYEKNEIEREIFPILLENEDTRSFTPTIWAKVFKKELYEYYQKQVDVSIEMGEDSVCVRPSVYHANSLYIHDTCSYYYRYNPTSITKSKKASNWNGPQMRAEHLIKYIDMRESDFQKQLYRTVVHSLFNVAVSQFNREEKYSVISKDIKRNITEGLYAEAIAKCSFRNSKGRLVLFALKYKATLLMKVYNILKKWIYMLYYHNNL